MSNLASRARFEPQRSLAFGSIGAAYMGVGTALVYAPRIVTIVNWTDALLQFSVGGTVDHFVVPPHGAYVVDLTANKAQPIEFALAAGDRLYVKEIEMPTKGSVYFSVMYGSADQEKL